MDRIGGEMADSYKTLARLFHMDTSNEALAHLDERARQRRESESTFRTGISVSSVTGSAVLSNELFVAAPRELTRALIDVLLAERRVARLWESVTGVMRWNYIVNSISGELYATNKMEGVRSTRKEVSEAVLAASEKKSGPQTRFSEFAKLYLGLTDDSSTAPATLEDIRSIYDKVVLGEVAKEDRPDGALFRSGDVQIIGSGGKAIHTGVSGEAQISALLTRMMALVSDGAVPSLLAALVSHFLFEYVHPFYDGNGRTGRYLLALYLKKDLTLPTVLSLSRTISDNKNAYYKAFTVAEDPLNRGELTSFVLTMLDLIRTAQRNLEDELAERSSLLTRAAQLSDRIAKDHALPRIASDLLYFVVQEEVFDTVKAFTIASAAKELHISKQTVRKYLAELEDEGLVRVVPGRPLRVVASDSVHRLIRRSIFGEETDENAQG